MLHKKILYEYFKLKVLTKYILVYLINKLYVPKLMPPKDIPIIINNRDRLTYLNMLITSLEKRGYHNIYIIDNASTYPPLLDYYDKECPYMVFRLAKNVGYTALWDTNLIKRFRSNYFVYTDSDIFLPDECPEDIIEVLLSFLKKYPKIHKAGPALAVDDLPKRNEKKVLESETNFWKIKVLENPLSYRACIDTTFALHRPWCFKHMGILIPQIRVAGIYTVKHMPWYETEDNMPKDSLYYREHTNSNSSWYVDKSNCNEG